MLPISRHLLVACLSVMKSLLYGVAGLLLLLIAVQYFRGEAQADPAHVATAAAIMAALGWISGCGARFVSRW